MARHAGDGRPWPARQQPDGLSTAEARRVSDAHGPNRLSGPRPARRWFGCCSSSTTFRWIYVLLGSAGIALLLGHLVDALVILAVVVANARHRLRAGGPGRAGPGLDPHHDRPCGVRGPRCAARTTVPAEAIVPGDVVLLDAGDRVPADLRLTALHATCGSTSSALTGESVPVEKGVAPSRC